ncbi:MAG: alpha/beta hydrolase [Acidobacteriota bacterium]
MATLNKKLIFKRVLWVFIPAVLVLFVGVFGLSFYLIHHLAHPPKNELTGSPRDFQIILQKPVWSDEKWKNADGTQAMGWLLNQNRVAPAVILTHGYSSNRSDLLTLSVELYKAGYHVLLYDMRGHGESPVNKSGFGMYEKDDLISAIKFLKGLTSKSGEELNDGRIGLYGVDLGGYATLAASDEDPAIKAVAVDSPFPSVEQFINYRLKYVIGGNNSMVKGLADYSLTKEVLGLTSQAYFMTKDDKSDVIESVRLSSNRRFLFIHGKTGSPTDLLTKEIFDETKGQKEIIEVEKTRQERLYTTESAAYDERVVKFFQAAIPTTAPKK